MSMAFDQDADPRMFAEVANDYGAASQFSEGKEFPQVGKSAPPGDTEIGYDYAHRVRGMIDDAREFNAEVLAPIRERGIQFYLGLVPALDDEGRSTIVATEVRDTVLAMLPSLIRIFTGQESTVNFMPSTEQGVPMSEQATDYINYIFQYDNPGYMIIMDVLKDALIKSMGGVIWWTDDNLEVVEERYERLTMEQRQFVISDPTAKVVDMQASSRPGPQGETIPSFDMTVRREKRAPKHRVMSVPPDEVRINRNAKNVKDAALVGREYFETQSALIRKGVDRQLILENRDFSGGDMRFSMERMLRNPGSDSPFGRDSMEPMCRYGEYWMRVDKDGDGLAELRHICVIGDNQTIVMDEPAARAKMALACVDPEPHTIVGHSVAELVADLQVIKTNMLRGSLDSLAQTIYPRLVGVDSLVDWDDVLNQAIGAPIRVKDISALTQLQYTFVGDPVFKMMDRLDAIRMARTGVTEQSKGLDPKALQSTTPKGVEMIVTGAQERIELVARTMAETFMQDLFAGLLQEVTEKPVPERVVKLRGNYVPVNPDQFDATMTCAPNGALGHGSDGERFTMLTTVLAEQKLIIQSQGADNPMVSPMEYRNTLEDILALAGFRNVSRYFKQITPEIMQQFQAAQASKADQNPEVIYAKAQADKVRADIVNTLATARVKVSETASKDDRERDKNEGDQFLKAAEIDAKYGAAVDVAAMKALWTAPRQPSSPPGEEPDQGSPPDPGMGGPSPPPGPGLASPSPGGPLPPLPKRTALGAGPPQLPPGTTHALPPPGLLGPGGPSQRG